MSAPQNQLQNQHFGYGVKDVQYIKNILFEIASRQETHSLPQSTAVIDRDSNNSITQIFRN